MTNAPVFSLLRRAALLAAAGFVFAASATAGIKSARLLNKIAHETPAPQVVAEGQQMKVAEQAAASITGAQTFWGLGHSMEPLYAPNTAVVVKPVAYDDIRKGMTLVYVKSNGHVVAHSVVDEDRRGYVVQGVNNDEADEESVNEKNLIGVVVAAYSASDAGFHSSLAKQLAASGHPAPAASRG
jgi:signal peptidase I